MLNIDTSSKKEQRNFGLVMGAALFILGCIRWALHGFADFPWVLVIIAVCFSLAGLLVPRILKPLLIVWIRLALVLNFIMTHLLLTIAFYGMITPACWIIRIFGEDPLKRKWLPADTTYWEDAEEQPEQIERYFNQF